MGRLCHARPQSGKQSDQDGTDEKAAAEPARAKRARAVSDICPRSAAPPSAASASSSPRSSAAGARSSARATPRSPRRNRSASRPARRAGGVLTLIVEGAHAPMMQHVAPAIIERVNRFFGYPAVERVRFRQGMVQAARARTRAGAAVAAADPGRAGGFAARGGRSGASRLPRIACARACRRAMAAPVRWRRSRSSAELVERRRDEGRRSRLGAAALALAPRRLRRRRRQQPGRRPPTRGAADPDPGAEQWRLDPDRQPDAGGRLPDGQSRRAGEAGRICLARPARTAPSSRSRATAALRDTYVPQRPGQLGIPHLSCSSRPTRRLRCCCAARRRRAFFRTVEQLYATSADWIGRLQIDCRRSSCSRSQAHAARRSGPPPLRPRDGLDAVLPPARHARGAVQSCLADRAGARAARRRSPAARATRGRSPARRPSSSTASSPRRRHLGRARAARCARRSAAEMQARAPLAAARRRRGGAAGGRGAAPQAAAPAQRDWTQTVVAHARGRLPDGQSRRAGEAGRICLADLPAIAPISPRRERRR